MQLLCMQLLYMHMLLACMHMLLVSGCIHRLYAAALYEHAAGLRLYTQAVCSCAVCNSYTCICCWPVCTCCWSQAVYTGCMQLLCMQLACMHMLLASGWIHRLYAAALYEHAAGLRLYTQAVCSCSVCTCCWPQAVYTGCMELLCMHMLLVSGCIHRLYAAPLYAHAAGLYAALLWALRWPVCSC